MTARIILFLILGICHPRAREGACAEGSAGRRTGERTHRGEYRGHVARLDGSEPARVAPGRGTGSLRWVRALRGSVQATETERRPRRCRGSARSRPGTAATSGSEGLERGVGPSTALSPRARSVRRGVTARAVLWFSPRRGGRRHRRGAGKAHSWRFPSWRRGAATVREPENAPERTPTHGNQSGKKVSEEPKM